MGGSPVKEYEALLQNQPVDVSEQFTNQHNHYFVGSAVREFEPDNGSGSVSGEILWKGISLKQRVSYHQLTLEFADYKVWWDTPPEEYDDQQALPFSLSFVSSRCVRLRCAARPKGIRDEPSLMLAGSPPVDVASWKSRGTESSTVYEGEFGSVSIDREPVRFEFRDASGRLLTGTHNLADAKGVVNSMPAPLCFVRNASNLHRHLAISFTLSPDEKLFGCGESFTRLDKRGQKLILWAYDAYSVQTPNMYKPVPFFMSSRGYGIFVHTSAPLTLDLGGSYDGAATVYLGDDVLDLFYFFGSPKEILSAYTSLTGRASVPPLWSFGLWMGRETYSSEGEVREVARKLREDRIPSDVIHLDTGWTEVPHRCDFEFSTSRFDDPKKMLSDLGDEGFRVSLWQLPYLNPNNKLHSEVTEKGYAVLSAYGKPPVDDAVIDLSNPGAVKWYQEKLAKLLEDGVGIFTADFGEAAPLTGLYHEDESSFLEHNLYPLRYNKAVADVTREVTGSGTIYARSAWAGSQRYPLHWGGDAEITDGAMASTLRGGLSLGLCGFTFWSHFIGGFSQSTPAALYLRWLAFGVLTSHSRCHGAPPTEPWEYGEDFVTKFRRIVEMRYRLMPYVYAQATLSSERGYPMLRTLFFEYPEDPACWMIEDEYMFGEDILVAPLMEETSSRTVYLPPGRWVDYQGAVTYEGTRWHRIEAGEVPAVVLVRHGGVVPRIELAQSTDQMDWSKLELAVFGADVSTAECSVCLPDHGGLHTVRLRNDGEGLVLQQDPLQSRVAFRIAHYA
jgi:alpha-D-xyloside xylohydrolase